MCHNNPISPKIFNSFLKHIRSKLIKKTSYQNQTPSMFGNLARKFLKPLVPVIRLNGEIDSTTTYLVSRSLKKISPGRSDAVGVVINSKGGSPAQCEIILKKIQEFCHEHHLPLYTFAEDQALSSGYWILCVGDKVYADKSSLIGNIGVSAIHTDVRSLYARYGVDVRAWTSDDNKTIPSMHYDIKDVHKESIMNWAEYTRKNFISHIEKYRKEKITVPATQREEKLYQGKAWTGKESLDYGLIDGFGTYASILFKEFPNSRIVNVSEKPTIEKYQEQAKTIVKFATSKALPWIVAYVLLKLAIKIYLVILVLGKKNSGNAKEQEEAKELEKVEQSI